MPVTLAGRHGAGYGTCPADDQKTKRRADLHGHYAELGDLETEQERAVGSGRDPVNPVRLGDRWATKVPACLGARTFAWRRFRSGGCRPPVAQELQELSPSARREILKPGADRSHCQTAGIATGTLFA